MMWWGSYCCNKACWHFLQRSMFADSANLTDDTYSYVSPLPSVHSSFTPYTLTLSNGSFVFCFAGGGGEIPWCFSQVKGTIEDEVADGKCSHYISHCPSATHPSCVYYNYAVCYIPTPLSIAN